MNSKYYMPTKVLMGNECIINNSEIFKALGKKAMLVTGAQSSKINGSQKDVETALDAVGIDYVVYDQVMSNPTIVCIYDGASFAKMNSVDFIVAIGGGSPMDAGKGIALLAAQDIAQEDLFSGNYDNKILPMAFVPTTAGTGSEVTQYSILTNDQAQTKTSIANDLLFPTVAFLDSKYMKKLSLSTTINTAIDALSHAVEGMLSVRASIISNALAAESIRMIMDCVPELLNALKSKQTLQLAPKTCDTLLQASYMAGMVIAQTGTTAVHAMGYSLTYFKDIDHGRANGLLLGEYLSFVEKENPALVKKILQAMNLSDLNIFKDLMNQLFGKKEVINSEEINQYSKMAIQTKNIANSAVRPNEEDLKEMMAIAFYLN